MLRHTAMGALIVAALSMGSTMASACDDDYTAHYGYGYSGYYSRPANSYHEPCVYRGRKACGYTKSACDVGVTYLYAPRHPFAPRWWVNRYVGWRTW
jgi:hypothetical protein